VRTRALALCLSLCACAKRTPDAPTVVPAAVPAPAKVDEPADEPDAPIDLFADLERLRAAASLPALAAIVIDADRTVAQGVAGVRRVGHEAKATLDDAFHLGSDTKAFTAFVAARLVDAGVVAWDTKLVDVWPARRKRIHADLRDVTLAQLLHHRAGLPHDPADRKLLLQPTDRPLVEQRRLIVESVLALAPIHAPGKQFEYSNAGYIVAGALLETKTGKSWEDLVREHVLDPLGMTSCGFGPTATPDDPDGVWAHGGESPGYVALAIDNPPAFGPAGTMHCALPDWAVFARAQLLRDPKLLQDATWTTLQTALPLPDRGGGYAMGWLVAELPWAKGVVLTHDGSNTVNYASAMLLVDPRIAVLVATNAGDAAAQRAVVTSVLGLAQRFSPAATQPRSGPVHRPVP
jgi:CubicO group peptidase (beta-lactamase class C family)